MPTISRRTQVEPALECPIDGAVMAKLEVEGVLIDRCGTCGGTWFDPRELRRVADREVEALATRVPTIRTESDFLCPRCGGQCLEAHVREVVVDHCLNCNGVWLDAGELEEAKRQLRVEKVLAGAGSGFREFLMRL